MIVELWSSCHLTICFSGTTQTHSALGGLCHHTSVSDSAKQLALIHSDHWNTLCAREVTSRKGMSVGSTNRLKKI